MNSIKSGFGLLVDVASVAAWGLTAFLITANLASTTAAGLLALAVSLSALAYMLSTRLQEARARDLMRGACPRCQTPLRRDHAHRRWDREGSRWLAPLTTWECFECGYGHEEPAPCDICPEAA